MTYSEKINSLLEQGILPTPDMFEEGESDQTKDLIENHQNLKKSSSVSLVSQPKEVIIKDSSVKVVFSYNKPSKKRTINDFVQLFNHRFKALERIIRTRPEMEGTVSINKLHFKNERDSVSIIGMISQKSVTKNKHIIISLEDLSGQSKVLISKNNKELHDIAKDLVLDEVIGISGTSGKDIIFANNIIFPDIPLTLELKKAPEVKYAVFISDIHMGSKEFLKEEFEKFITWINGEMGSTEQREIANKSKYLFLVGDLVEGVGVYPGQEEDLLIPDIKEQYRVLASYLKKIKSDKKIIICPGNHDAGRIAEPQPPIYNDFAEAIWELPGAIIVSNPAIVNIESSETFSGLDVLLYHGYSLIYYADNVESIRSAGGQKKVDLIMKFLLQKRHLAPTHESNMYIPDADEDPLVISKIPDVFVSGHIHRAMALQHKSVTLINSSCWGDITDDQEKRGLEPQPGRVMVLNLQSRKVKIINFYNR